MKELAGVNNISRRKLDLEITYGKKETLFGVLLLEATLV